METTLRTPSLYDLHSALQAHKQGNADATEWLVLQMEHHRSRLLQYCVQRGVDSDTAEDLIQDTILKALTPHQIEALAEWGADADLCIHLRKILRGEISTYLKTKGRREALLEQLASEQREKGRCFEVELIARISTNEFAELFWREIRGCLNETEQQILWLRYVEELEWKEISQILLISNGALRQRDRHIREKLRRWKPLAQLCRDFGFLQSHTDV